MLNLVTLPSLVPALAVSFSDLDKRVEAQKKQKDAQIATLQVLEAFDMYVIL